MKYYHLLLIALLSFILLYSPQAILPRIVETLHLSSYHAGLLVTVTMLPLAIGPLVYGFFLVHFKPIKLLKIAFALLVVSSLLFAFSKTYEQLLIIRFAQGLILPAILVSITTHLGTVYRYHYRTSAISGYVFSTISGGFLSRLLSSVFASIIPWQTYFEILSLVLFIAAVSLIPCKDSKFERLTEATSVKFTEHLQLAFKHNTCLIYLAVFLMFFCFSAFMNFLPFILKNDYHFNSGWTIGLVYTAYFIAAALSFFFAKKLLTSFSKLSTLTYAFVAYCITILLFYPHSFALFFTAFLLFCLSMFIIHTTAAPFINQISLASPSLSNGLYNSFYYAGGTLGTFLPGYIYEHYGKNYFILCLLAACFLGLLVVLAYRWAMKKQSQRESQITELNSS